MPRAKKERLTEVATPEPQLVSETEKTQKKPPKTTRRPQVAAADTVQAEETAPTAAKRTRTTRAAQTEAPAPVKPAPAKAKSTRKAAPKAASQKAVAQAPTPQALAPEAPAAPVAEVVTEAPKPRRTRKADTAPKATAPKRAAKGKAPKAAEPSAAAVDIEVVTPAEAVAVVEDSAREDGARAETPEVVRAAPIVPAEREVDLPAPPAPKPVLVTEPEIVSDDPTEQQVVAQLRKLGRPIHVRDLERSFTRTMANRVGNWRDLETLLDDLTRRGLVIRTRKRTYGLPEAMSLVRGRFQASAAGFGFVIPDSNAGKGGGEDFYIAPDDTLEAWNGDIVLVRMEGRGDTMREGSRGPRRGQRGDGNPRASVARIVQRAYHHLVGTLELSRGHPILRPDDHRARHRILLIPEGIEGLESGARVVAELYWPEATGEDEVFGQVIRVLGAQDDPTTETEAVIVKYGLRGDFPPEVEAAANAIPDEIPAEALLGRLDLRDLNTFTVDGRDAKDFDDAIHIQSTPEGNFVVGIHIADVSHYVTEGGVIDQEAYARATSVYLPGRVLPMLPEHLSNGVCSLVPYQDRLTMSALVELSPEGDILDVQLAPSVINSKARLTYDEVQAYSEAVATLPERARALEGDMHLLLKITAKLRQKRLREGALDFKLREVKVDVGPDGKMELIPIREETARGLIEDLMLLANKVVAHYLLERQIPALYRIHEEPTLQRFQEVSQAIGRLGLAFPGGEATPQAYQAVLKQVRGTGRETVVNTLLLRSMQQAKYAHENLGHFGLAFDEYLHFTSPIRRYPDLLVHRVLRGVLAGELKAGGRQLAELGSRLPAMGEHTSERERAATEAERDLTKYYQAKWAQEHLGETFTGNVSGVVGTGLFVALENGVEGKLHISYLDDDYYIFIEDAQMLRGRSNGQTYRLGDTVTVTIGQVNPLARQIDFVRPDTEENTMDGNEQARPRARRREEREAERQEKLRAVTPSAPRKFTLEDETARPAPRPAQSQQRGRGRGRGSQPQSQSQGQGQSMGRQTAGTTFRGNAPMPARDGSSPRSSQGYQRARRVVTLERPRSEHLRPVNITVQRMYFGDWTVDNMPEPEIAGGGENGRNYGRDDRFRGDRGDRSGGERSGGRSSGGRSGGGAGQGRRRRR